MNGFSWMHQSPRKYQEPTLDVCEEIRITQNNRKIIFRPDDNKITYQNVISPTEGGRHFPPGYFDSKTAYIPISELEPCKLIISKALAQLPLKEPQGFSMPGGSLGCVLVFRYQDGSEVRCSDTFPAPSPSVKSEKIPGFLVIYHLLNSYCAISADRDAELAQFRTYYEETWWTCKRCSTQNVMTQCFCRNCGARNRG